MFHDWAVACKLVLSIAVMTVAFALRAWADLMLIIVVTTTVLAAEIFNSAIEALCDFVETRHNEKIRVIKDVAAVAVGMSIPAWHLVLGGEAARIIDAVRG